MKGEQETERIENIRQQIALYAHSPKTKKYSQLGKF